MIIATACPHPITVIPSTVQLADILGVSTTDEKDTETYEAISHSKKVCIDSGELYSVTLSRVSQEKQNKMGELMQNTLDKDVIEAPTIDDARLEHLSEEHRDRVREILNKFPSMWNGTLGEINTIEHNIDLIPGTKAFFSHPYRAGPKQRAVAQAEIDRMLRLGVIEKAQSPWASPVVFAPKKDGTLRFCVDYRRLNSVTIRDTYPIPKMDECIDSLGDASIFTTLDCNSGYWQTPLAKDDRDKTAFTCHAGLYRFIRMPFGLMNAPATFQRALDMILSRFKWKTCLVYLDDVIIYSNNMDDHFKHVEEILSCLSNAGITLKLKKCDFFTDTVNYLGHKIRPGHLETDKAVTAALKEAKHPRDQTELKSFLGLCNVYRRFVPRYSHVAAPLNKLLRKDQAFKLGPLTPDQKQAFDSLVKAVTEPPVLALPKLGLPYSVDTDASDYQVGCALFQTYPDGTRKPIGYWSRSWTSAEKTYSVTEKECLAVVYVLLALRPYLIMEKTTVHTDYASLRWLMTITDPSGRLMHWRLRLSEYDFEVQYKKGLKNYQADALSRLP
ncbi:MAG: reverse transcriptase/ribonuclease H family protein, partial [Sphaerochaetaceae bacterium]